MLLQGLYCELGLVEKLTGILQVVDGIVNRVWTHSPTVTLH